MIEELTQVQSVTTLRNVTRIQRRGIDYIYRAVMSIYQLWSLLNHARVQYAPKYQRGYVKRMVDLPEEYYDPDQLAPIHSKELDIREERANEIAVKYLRGNYYNPSVTWNARLELDEEVPVYDEKEKSLGIFSVITIPDSGHRHRAFYNLVLWKRDSNKIPRNGVLVNDEIVDKEQIIKLLDDFDPKAEYIYIDVFTLEAKREGYLYDEYNSDSKPPSNAVAIDLNPEKTPSRRFVYRLMEVSRTAQGMLAPEQVETRRNSVARKSRKLVTNATLDASIREYSRELAEIEKDPEVYQDLVEFFVSFFEEFGTHYPEWNPDPRNDYETRWKLRERSFALSNIIFFPFSRMAFELWRRYRKEGRPWRKEKAWRVALAKIAGQTEEVYIEDGENRRWKGDVLDRKNPAWVGKIIIRVYDEHGKYMDSMSSTRQTREAMYQYLKKIAAL